ncbi:hypothetical protein GDO81_018090 [Engystomops pustulosus]|uniref:Uncharacterized protein n=1 Tax=Engystomops pustulosus TaxID=76066 RepID=A0AAV7AAF8_ENGPU|nr:hypothetical protein GDO81_018090 [Engystomops pustulosus]
MIFHRKNGENALNWLQKNKKDVFIILCCPGSTVLHLSNDRLCQVLTTGREWLREHCGTQHQDRRGREYKEH